MRNLILLSVLMVSIISCQENEAVKSEFTGNEVTYPLLPGSAYAISGTVKLREKTDGSTLISVELTGTDGNLQHPTHLHLGNIASADAEVSVLLNPVSSKTGLSETLVTRLADESSITYAELVKLNACIKVHLAEAGPDKNIILAGGNIGIASADDLSAGRLRIGVCASN